MDDITTFKPRFTKLVPVHPGYVGGQQYFVESKKEESIFHYLFEPIDKKILEKLETPNRIYLRKNQERRSFESDALADLTYAIVNYFIATAVRRLQECDANEPYKSSALVHLDIAQKSHDWQLELISQLIEDICAEYVNNPYTCVHRTIQECQQNCYQKMVQVSENGWKETNEHYKLDVVLPDYDDVCLEMERIIRDHNYAVKIVNSSKAGRPQLDDEGQLKLDKTANIFIGGSILDRGITISNMLLFFYGRDPHKMQMDTVLQHARMYGSRSMRDIAVTSFRTTSEIYSILEKMNEVDEELRIWIANGLDKEDPQAVFVGTDSRFKLCASQKIRVSNTMALRPYKRILPIGFQTLPKTKMESIMKELDTMIKNAGYREDKEFFELSVETAYEILRKISTTYVYGARYKNEDYAWDVQEILGAIQYATTKSNGKLYGYVRSNADAARIKEDRKFNDTPDDGKKENPAIRAFADDAPVLMFLRENGDEIKGWRDAPFYWPVFVMQKKIKHAVFTVNNQVKRRVRKAKDYKDLLDGINDEDIIKLSITEDPFQEILHGDKIFEYRELKNTTKGKILDFNPITKEPLLANGVNAAPASIYTFNEGVFPFQVHQYKYMLLVGGQTGNNKYILARLESVDQYQYLSDVYVDDDNYTNRQGELVEISEEEKCRWIIGYKIAYVYKTLIDSEKADADTLYVTASTEEFMMISNKIQKHFDIEVTKKNSKQLLQMNDDGTFKTDAKGSYIPSSFATLQIRTLQKQVDEDGLVNSFISDEIVANVKKCEVKSIQIIMNPETGETRTTQVVSYSLGRIKRIVDSQA